jgi:hypothetical protein
MLKNIFKKNKLTHFDNIYNNALDVLDTLLSNLESTNKQLTDYITDEKFIVNEHQSNITIAQSYIVSNNELIDFIKDFFDEYQSY